MGTKQMQVQQLSLFGCALVSAPQRQLFRRACHQLEVETMSPSVCIQLWGVLWNGQIHLPPEHRRR
jgi:hypothetical protein